MSDTTLQKPKTSKRFHEESQLLTESFRVEIMEQMIAFKEFCLSLSKENINTQPLSKLLSTISGLSQVEKGHLVILKEKISTTPVLMNRKHLTVLAETILEDIWTSESILEESLECLSTGSAQS